MSGGQGGSAEGGAQRRVDPAAARARFDAALDGHHQDFETFFLARLIGLEFDYLPTGASDPEKEACRLTFPVGEMLMNPQGSLHGGIIATAMDISMGHLLRKVQGAAGATIEMKVQYLRPVGPGQAVCEGRFIRRGRALSFMESRMFNDEGKLAAHATATWKMPG
ncbi:thioesterase [Brevirhabdus pacifica]|uniref:Thioesterase n=1 Tax=Brevirhabdus pacifica TaxID=1267768 RepID=A0A1U7DKH2_9RHOB|nr:PaaI family thioesterase [Brevirhabdus pacifica]APX90472.1 thioesterase [Brevirhabdus pacifica]PJJ85425.1 uncharacterized protein (TIGR00369 family) [Brevirhabdus pacifica]